MNSSHVYSTRATPGYKVLTVNLETGEATVGNTKLQVYVFDPRNKRLDAPIEADVELSDITRDPQVRERIIGLLGSVRVGRVNHRYAPEFISVHTRPVCEQDEAYLVVFGAGRE